MNERETSYPGSTSISKTAVICRRYTWQRIAVKWLNNGRGWFRWLFDKERKRKEFVHAVAFHFVERALEDQPNRIRCYASYLVRLARREAPLLDYSIFQVIVAGARRDSKALSTSITHGYHYIL